MKKMIIAAVAAGVALLVAAGVAVAWPQASRAGRTVATSGPVPIAYNGIDGWSHGRARLPVIYIGESNVFLRIPRWSHWNAISASARGTLWVNTCTPTCAAGNYQKYPASVAFSTVATRNGVAYFSKMTLSYSHNGQRHYAYRWGALNGATIPGWNGGPG